MSDRAQEIAKQSNTAWLQEEVKRLKLNVRQAGCLSDLVNGVERNAKLRYYPFGSRDADHPLVAVMRAFTHDGGGFLREEDDIRDGYVWCSGIFERWLKVEDLIKAIDNIDGKHGLDEPMAVIDTEGTS